MFRYLSELWWCWWFGAPSPSHQGQDCVIHALRMEFDQKLAKNNQPQLDDSTLVQELITLGRDTMALLQAQLIFRPQSFDGPNTKALLTIPEAETPSSMLQPMLNHLTRQGRAAVGIKQHPICSQRLAPAERNVQSWRNKSSTEKKPSNGEIDFITGSCHTQRTERF